MYYIYVGFADVLYGNFDFTHVRVDRHVVVFDGQLQSLGAVQLHLVQEVFIPWGVEVDFNRSCLLLTFSID